MPCPISSVLGLGAVFGGVHSLLFQDRRWRWLAWAALLGLSAGWTAYFVAFRVPAARIGLEVVSVATLVVAGFRLRWLIRTRTTQPLLYRPLARTLRALAPVFSSMWVVSAKVWLLAMLVMEWRGKARFSPLEYGVVTAVLMALIALRIRSLSRARREFSALEALASGKVVAPGCPLGFGCAADLRAAGESTRAPRPAAVAGRLAVFDEPDVTPARRA